MKVAALLSFVAAAGASTLNFDADGRSSIKLTRPADQDDLTLQGCASGDFNLCALGGIQGDAQGLRQELDVVKQEIISIQDRLTILEAAPTPAPAPEIRRSTLNFAGLLGPDKSSKGWTQCWGYGKNNPGTGWDTAMASCGDYDSVVFAGERCDGTWVEFPMDLRSPLRNYMKGGGSNSPQTNIDTNNGFNIEWDNTWWVLTKGGWNDGPSGTARCWEPDMTGSTGNDQGHILDQQCRGNQDTTQQRHCNDDKYYVYGNHKIASSTDARARFISGFVGTAGPDKSAAGMTQCFGYGKDDPADWANARAACGDKRKVVFAGYRCDGTWVAFDMELKTPLRNYMNSGTDTSTEVRENIDVNGEFNMQWSSNWWVLTKGGWNDGPSGTARCWEPDMAGSTGNDQGHILDQQCRGNQDTTQQRHCNDDQYFIYFKD
jgi:hypothetical protein